MINNNTDVFLIIDVQNDFCPGGALAVADGDAVVAPINSLSSKFTHRVVTQDWHPAGHLSFACSHAGAEPFSEIELAYGPQTLWPEHCVQGSEGAAFHKDLEVTGAELIIRKGFRREVDSYSAFFENDKKTATGLAGYLKERGFQRVFLAGLATDFCVTFSALDSVTHEFDTYVFEDACRSINMNGSLEASRQKMTDAGVKLIHSNAV